MRTLDSSDSSGCSSLTSRSPTSAATSPLSSLHSGKSDNCQISDNVVGNHDNKFVSIGSTPPDLLLWHGHRNPENVVNTIVTVKPEQKSHKEDLIAEIEQKLTDLNAQKLSVEECIRQNEALGQGITCLVESRATSKEYSKFRLHIEDIDKITSLLVSLSGRLARVESAILAIDAGEDSTEDKVNEIKVKYIQFILGHSVTLIQNRTYYLDHIDHVDTLCERTIAMKNDEI